MIKNIIKVAFRSLLKQKGYSILNIMGLSISLVCAFLIALWVIDEVNYDHFHTEGDRIYRILRHARFGEDVFTEDTAPWPLLQEIKKYPEVENVAYIRSNVNFIFSKDRFNIRQQGFFANQDFFDIFSWNLIKGDYSSVLNTPSSIVISATLADKYFGSDWRKEENIIGQTVQVNGEINQTDYHKEFVISGVFEKIPHNSSLKFDFVLPIEEYLSLSNINSINNWDNSNFQFFVKLQKGFNFLSLSKKIVNLQNNHIKGFQSDLFLQKYTDQHMHSTFQNGLLVSGRNMYYTKIFILIAFIIILIAGINFINLTTARSSFRLKEIGIRKSVGAKRTFLIMQFIGESLILVFISFFIGLVLVVILLPVFNNLTGKEILINSFNWKITLLFIGLGFFTALISVVYPAIYMSALSPMSILHNNFRRKDGGKLFRNGLVVVQFTTSILLVIGTITISQQIKYILTKDLGLDRENVIYLNLENKMRSQRESIKNELLQEQGIASITATNGNPMKIESSTHTVRWRGKEQEKEIEFKLLAVDYDFLKVMAMELADGNDFDPKFSSEPANYIINEKAASVMGFENPVGESLSLWENETGRIIGVVKNFNMSSLYSEIKPTIIRLRPWETTQLFIRTEPGRTKEAIESLKKIHEKFASEYPYEYHFLDENYYQMYHKEIVIGKLIKYLTVLALLIACFGLFGLATYSAEVRTKEIGIRKVNGARISEVMTMLNRDFVQWVAIAFGFATPVAYYAMNKWLENFAYKTSLSWWIFALAGLLALGIALLTVSFQSWKAASRNPVESLRYE